jgi:hypothetical protein
MPETAFDIADLVQQYRPKPNEVDPETQRRIAKGNAVAEAFRVLIDSVGASKGANVVERTAPANAVMGAVEKYYKMKDANKAEQDSWNRLELGTKIDDLKTQSATKAALDKQKADQTFDEAQLARQQEFTAGQNDLNRGVQTKNLEYDSARLAFEREKFDKSLGLDTRRQSAAESAKKTDAEIEREKIAAASGKTRYGGEGFKGLSVTDVEAGQTFGLQDNVISQVLSFMQNDPAVQSDIGMIKAKYNNLGSSPEVEKLITDNFPKLSAETKQNIRALSSGSVPFQPQAPTIKTNKGSTMVQVNQPAPVTSEYTPDNIAAVKKIMSASTTPEKKRAAIYKYLIQSGYDNARAQADAEEVYQSLISK